MFSKKLFRIVCVLFVLRGEHVFAQDPHEAKPERPTVATHAWTVAPKYAELETGVEIDDPGSAWSVQTPTVLKLGVGRRAQLSLQSSVNGGEGLTLGPGDTAVFLKYRFSDKLPLLGAFAIQPGIKFPTGGESHGTDTIDASVLFISSHSFGDISLDVNVGYTRSFGDFPIALIAIYPPPPVHVSRNTMLWTVSTGGTISGRLGFAAEVFGYPSSAGANVGTAGPEATAAALFGPTFTIRPWAVVDAGAIVALRGDQPNALYAGLVYNLGKF